MDMVGVGDGMELKGRGPNSWHPEMSLSYCKTGQQPMFRICQMFISYPSSKDG